MAAVAASVALGTALFAASRIRPDIRKTSCPFATKDGQVLYMDRYETENWFRHRRPVLIFAFGGGFCRGRRDNPQYVDFLNFMARKGYVVVAFDYRKGLRKLPSECRKSTRAFLGALQNAVSMAADDLIDVTAFVINHAHEWSIDPKRIVACGSSAGAMTVLQTEYELCNGTLHDGRLPAGFNYAGVVSFAGAVVAAARPDWKEMPCPVMLFHGDADKRVPFKKAAIPGIGGLWGSATIAETLKEKHAPYYIYIVENASHEVCKSPMTNYRNAILEFLDKFVRGKQQQYVTAQNHHDKHAVRKDFSIKEYILNNM